jgi:CRISPR-associated protein (TIGR02710 family)
LSLLICTVGGSHQPIEKAIKTIQPSKVIFVCSNDDKETGRKGSYVSVNGLGNVNKSSASSQKCDLPNLQTLTQLDDQQTVIITVSPDDLSACYRQIQKGIQHQDSSQLVADYTGGTKTMSAALAMIAADYNILLNLIVGTRADHIKVKDGSHDSITLDIQQLRDQRRLKEASQQWQSYAYQRSKVMAEEIKLTLNNKANRNTLIQLSSAFAAWDCFDHKQAQDLLNDHKAKIGPYFSGYLTVIKHLVDAKSEQHNLKYTPYLILDVWNNALRKASQGYYDDAIARVYRVLEWSAQWILLKEKQWYTGDLPEQPYPASINITLNREGKRQASLFTAWQLVQHYGDSQSAAFAHQHLDSMMTHMSIRNNSILAHGFTPVESTQWLSLQGWITDHLIPLLKALAADASIGKKIDEKAMQLPTLYPMELFE